MFDATTGRLEGGVGDNGSRPGEFVGAWSVDPVAGHADSFWVYDVSLHRLTRVDLRRRPGAAPSFQLTPVDLVTDAAVLYAARAAGGGFAALGMFNTARIAFFDSAGKLTRLPPGSPPGSDTIAVSVRQHAYQSRMRPNADRSRWALAARNAGRLEVYDSSGSLVAEAKVPFRFEPKYLARVRRGTALMSSGRDLRVGYVDVATTENLIFALFSGRTGVSHGMGRSSFGEYVHVFDWDGALRGVLRLDGAEASSIAVDERGTTLYALRQYPSRSVIAYPVEGALPPGIAPAPSVGYAGRHSDH